MTFVAIRADASRAIGWGHVKRCLALAHALREAGASPILVSRPSDVAVDALCATAGVPLDSLADSLVAALAPLPEHYPMPHARIEA